MLSLLFASSMLFASPSSGSGQNQDLLATADERLIIAQTASKRAASVANSSSQAAIPDPLRWFHSWATKNQKILDQLPRTVLMLEEVPKGPGMPKLMELNAFKFNSLSWTKVISNKDFNAIQALNSGRETFQLQANNLPQWYHLLLKVTGSHVLIHGNQGAGIWNLYAEEPIAGKAGFKPQLSRPTAPADLSLKNLHEWLIQQLGYDGIVLDQRQNHVLIALIKPQTELSQGFVISDSAQAKFVKKQDQTPAGLFNLRGIRQEFAVAEMFLQQHPSKPLAPGTKVIFASN